MTGRVLPFDQATHKVVDVLLPWFVNGTLDRDERELVQAHLSECSECQQQLEWLRDLHAACSVAAAQPGASKALERLHQQLASPRPSRSDTPRLAETRFGRGSRLPWAIAAAVILLVGIAGLWGSALEPLALYRTLGAHDAPARTQGTMVVVFDPATRESEIRRIVRASGARIVDGPTTTNGYVLDLAPEREPQALQLLRSERAVVLAEPLGPTAARR